MKSYIILKLNSGRWGIVEKEAHLFAENMILEMKQ